MAGFNYPSLVWAGNVELVTPHLLGFSGRIPVPATPKTYHVSVGRHYHTNLGGNWVNDEQAYPKRS